MPSIRITVLNVEESMSPLKFRGWLRTEAINIQKSAQNKDDIILIRLLMLERLRLAITQPALDKIINAIVDKQPNIYCIDLQTFDAPLSPSELLEEVKIAQNDLNAAFEHMGSGSQKPPTPQ